MPTASWWISAAYGTGSSTKITQSASFVCQVIFLSFLPGNRDLPWDDEIFLNDKDALQPVTVTLPTLPGGVASCCGGDLSPGLIVEREPRLHRHDRTSSAAVTSRPADACPGGRLADLPRRLGGRHEGSGDQSAGCTGGDDRGRRAAAAGPGRGAGPGEGSRGGELG